MIEDFDDAGLQVHAAREPRPRIDGHVRPILVERKIRAIMLEHQLAAALIGSADHREKERWRKIVSALPRDFDHRIAKDRFGIAEQAVHIEDDGVNRAWQKHARV